MEALGYCQKLHVTVKSNNLNRVRLEILDVVSQRLVFVKTDPE